VTIGAAASTPSEVVKQVLASIERQVSWGSTFKRLKGVLVSRSSRLIADKSSHGMVCPVSFRESLGLGFTASS